jgi:hypothetical protein
LYQQHINYRLLAVVVAVEAQQQQVLILLPVHNLH